MRLLVETMIAERHYGLIFGASLVADEGGFARGQRLRVRANFEKLLGAPAAGETWEIRGHVNNGAYGLQIEAAGGRRILSSGRMIVRFLANHVPGVGEERAGRLWRRFGENLAEVLSDEGALDEIAETLAGDRPILARRLAVLVMSAWRLADGEARLIDWLGRNGVDDLKLVRRLHRAMGDSATEQLAANPYVMVPLLPWKRVDALGQRLLREDGRDPLQDRRRTIGAADEIVKRMLKRGDTAMEATAYARELASTLGLSPDQVGRATAAAVSAGAVLPAGSLVRAPGAASLEDDLSSRLRKLSVGPPEPRLARLGAKRWSEVITEVSVSSAAPTASQAAAVAFALSRSLACLVGGAGTGKTYTCRLICDVWVRAGGEIVLCALAGKAALRLSRSTGRLAKTIARTLAELAEREQMEDKLPDTPEGPERAQMIERLENLARITDRTLLVVDEASMVDLPTVHALVSRLVAGSRLLFVGDEAQLPPIGFGLVFAHLVADPATAFRLSEVHRQASTTGIPDVAAAIRCGETPRVRPFEGLSDGVSFIPCERSRLGDTVVEVSQGLGPDCLVVTATISGAAGVENVNARRHAITAPDEEEFVGPLGRRFATGEPVIFGRNDYRAGLFNGQFGKVVAFDRDEFWMDVLFDGEAEPKRLFEDELVELDLAYAVTCHKCQGSSAARVVVPIYGSRLLDRSWLYTATTRAERQVVLIGDPSVLREAVSKPPAHMNRRTGFRWAA